MNIKQEYKIFLLENKIKQATKHLWILHYIIPVIHMMFLAILGLLKTDFQFEGSLSFMKDFQTNMQ